MKRYSLKSLYVLYSMMVVTTLSHAQIPVFNSVTQNTAAPAKFDKFELDINLTAGYTNAYDYDDIAVQCIFTAPSARKDTVDGFFMQEYTFDISNNLIPSGSGTFKIRYAPNETGTWSYVLSCKNLSGTTAQPAQVFQCSSSTAAGFIRKNTTNYLSLDNGTQYIPIGENMGWQDGNVVTDYANWMTKLADNGGNFIRVWMSDWAFALEWKNGSNGYSGLKKYKQPSAFYLDWLLNYCSQKGVYIMLCLNHHGQVSSGVNPEWSDNPYNTANGGPCANTWDFFTNATAKALHKNRTRYVIARYGYSRNIQSWELFNEVEWTDQFDSHKTEITSWHNEMASFIKSKDVYKHLITTSYAIDNNDDATWNLADIDFTQTHYYVGAPNIESVLAAGVQDYLTSYGKPTINGEFGLNTDGSGLAAMDANGTHIHNAIWGSLMGGGMGTAMSWWWDNYIEPQNLYYHYKPLSSFVSVVHFKDDDYKKTSSTTTGGGVADVSISPGAGWSAATAASFTIDASGAISPGVNQLGQYLYGSQWNTQYRNPPTFNITYPSSGQFKVVTGSSLGQDAHITIYVDNAQQLDQVAAINTTYSVSITAGAHAIKVDNLGTDWANIGNYIFTGAGSALSSYLLKSADTKKAAGWILNSSYNWKYLQDNSGTAPPPVNGASLQITGMQNDSYIITFYSCSTGLTTGTANATAAGNVLSFSLPLVAWDIAFTAVANSVLPLQLSKFYGESKNEKNNLYITIGEVVNIKDIIIERSGNGVLFSSIGKLKDAKLQGRHVYIDTKPLSGNNFYRLRIVDNDGKESFSPVVKLVNNFAKYSVYPNPFNYYVRLKIEEGKYKIQITDQGCRIVLSKFVHTTTNIQDVKLPLASLSSGVYFLRVIDEHGTVLAYEKIVK